MKSTRLFLVSLIIISCFTACTNTADKDKNDDGLTTDEAKADKGDDPEFLRDAASINLEEIRISELALTMATMQETKDMAQMMVTDHKAAYAQLTALAAAKGVSIPTSADDEANRKHERLSKKEGADFDKDYSDMLVTSHKAAINRFERAVSDCDDAAVVSWASSILPKLKEHLTHAEHCQEMAKDAK